MDGLTGVVWYSALLLDDPGKYISDDDATQILLLDLATAKTMPAAMITLFV